MLQGHVAACGMMGHVAYLLFSIINKERRYMLWQRKKRSQGNKDAKAGGKSMSYI